MLKPANIQVEDRPDVLTLARWEAPRADFEPRGVGEQCLIADGNTISELLEDIWLQKSSYGLIQAPCVREEAYGSTEFVGFHVVEGGMEVEWADGDVERMEAPGFILLAPRQPFTVRIVSTEGRCRIGRVSFRLDAPRARLLFKLLPSTLPIRDLATSEIEWHAMLAHLISDQPKSFSPANAAINRRLVEAALISVIQMFLERNAALGGPLTDSRIAPSLRAIHESPGKPWTNASLANLAGMSRTLFATTFTESTGETPRRYLSRLRLERARDLLQHSSLPLAMVAYRAGYGSDVAFVRAFKRQFGVSPGRFRSDHH